MIYVYGAACFLEALTMALGIGRRSRLFNVIAAILAVAAVCLHLYGFPGHSIASGCIHAFAQSVVIFSNGVIVGMRKK